MRITKQQADLIPLKKKVELLRSLSEDDFRDQVVRPLFLRKGFTHGEELCGNDEEGKDCYFTTTDQMGVEMIYAIQTKAGNINMSSETTKNLVVATTQMHTLMNTYVICTKTKQKRKANVGILCASGKINQLARRHIIDEVKEPNLRFLDSHDLITEIDAIFPEFWSGISSQRNPYLIALHEDLNNAKDDLSLANILADLEITSAVTEEGYANLRLSRTFIKYEKYHGNVIQKPDFEEISGVELLARRKKHILVKGEGGFGKSTLLRRIAEILTGRTLAGHSDEIPVILRAKSLIADESPLVQIAIEATERISPGMGCAPFLEENLRSGNLLLLIDALDEIPEEEMKLKAERKMAAFCASYPLCRVILTSRPNSFLSKSKFFTSFEEWNVLPLEIREAKRLLDQAAKNKVIPVEKTAEILRQLNNIHGVEINPLLVTIMTATADAQRKDIPANLTELFAKFSEIMLGRWDSKKGFSQQFEGPLKHKLLGQLALALHKTDSTSMSLNTCEDFLRDRLKRLTNSSDKVRILMDEIVNRSGLLRVTESGVEFRHLLLQEYFAGSAVKNVDEILPFVGEEWWRRVIVFYFGSNPDDGVGLLSVAADSRTSTPDASFCAAITVGLASQACYFVDIPDRIDIIKWVCKGLADNLDGYLDESKYPLNSFIYAYLTGRDAVASDILTEVAEGMTDETTWTETTKFWVIAGLLESGEVDSVYKFVKNGEIIDSKLLLALHLGAFNLSKARIATKETKKTAEALCEHLEPFIARHRKEILKEFKSILLEVRGGKIIEADVEVDA